MLDNYLLYNTWPSIDLHGYDRDTARVAIEDFIKDSLILKNKYIVIIHGIGSGIIRKTTVDVVSKNKHVKAYKISNFNPGMTVLELDI